MAEDILFKHLFKELRCSRGLSQTGVADLVGTHKANVCAIEAGRRPCGYVLALKLASALRLEGQQLLDFLRAARKTCSGEEELNHVDQVLGELARVWLLAMTRGFGVGFGDIATVRTASNQKYDVEIELQDGRCIGLELKAASIAKS